MPGAIHQSLICIQQLLSEHMHSLKLAPDYQSICIALKLAPQEGFPLLAPDYINGQLFKTYGILYHKKVYFGNFLYCHFNT